MKMTNEKYMEYYSTTYQEIVKNLWPAQREDNKISDLLERCLVLLWHSQQKIHRFCVCNFKNNLWEGKNITNKRIAGYSPQQTLALV